MPGQRPQSQWPRKQWHSLHWLIESPSLPSCVMVVIAVDRAIGTRVVAHGPRHIGHFTDPVQTPSLVLSDRNYREHCNAVNQKKSPNHEFSSSSEMPRVIGFAGFSSSGSPETLGSSSLSAQRRCSKLIDLQVRKTAGRSSASAHKPKKHACGTSRLQVRV